MPFGTPDFFEPSVYTTHSIFTMERFEVTAEWELDTLLADIEAKGTLKGLGINIVGDTFPGTDRLYFLVDSVEVGSWIINDLYDNYNIVEKMDMLRIINYDVVGKKIALALGYDISFDRRVALYYYRTDEGVSVVSGNVAYDIIPNVL